MAPNDKRNAITGYAASSATAGGAAPLIDPSGALTWLPNDADFAGTTSLRLVVNLATGAPVEISLPVQVVNERLVHQEALPASSGSIADPQGRYLIKVEPEVPGTTMTGMLSIYERFNASGRYIYAIRTPTNPGVKVTVIYAPNLHSVPASGATFANGAAIAKSGRSAAGGRKRALASAGAAQWETDIGAALHPSLSGHFGQLASVGQVNVYTTRTVPFHYSWTNALGFTWSFSAEPDQPNYQIDGNCKTATACDAIKDPAGVNRSPIILIHGFNLIHWFNSSKPFGGGEGTWGTLAETLRKRGHPVFELRWNTSMRFEEAAGVLAQLAARVAGMTQNKVSVVAHSFGGIAAHQAMMGKGIRYTGSDGWEPVPVDGVFQRLITLGSPLSGISYLGSESLGLTAGRDDDDQTIDQCEAITCFQAGSGTEAYWGSKETDELVQKIRAIDVRRIGLSDRRDGESIRTLHKFWAGAGENGHGVPFTTIVSLKKRPFDDYLPDLNASTAHDLGDGLISMIGQAVVPTDFSANPYGPKTGYNFPGAIQPDFLNLLDTRFAANTEHRTLNGRDYYFALKAAHSCGQIGGGADCLWDWLPIVSSAFLIANYPDGGVVNVEGYPPADHPLKFFIESPVHLAEPRVAYVAPLPPPESRVFGKIIQNGRPAEKVPTFQIERKDGDVPVGDQLPVRSNSANGNFTFDAGAALGLLFPNKALALSDFNVVFRVGDDLSEKMIQPIRKPLTASLDLGTIDVSLTGPAALITATGYVAEPPPARRAIEGATVRLIKGENQTIATLQEVRDTTVSKRLTTDAQGRYTPTGIEPGTYSLLVTKSGYVDAYLGNVVIDTTGIIPVILTPGGGGPAGIRLNDTGITAAQCYAAGSNALVSCGSAAAIALNDQQDGMVGRDVTNNDNSDGKAGFSFSLVARPGGSYAKTECVRDNVTGLVWEGKTNDGGVRDASRAYTNWGDGRAGDASAYVGQVNAIALCGYSDWRLPKVRELQSIVDYGVASPWPTIDMVWFSNTQGYVYWSSSPYAGGADLAWYVDFSNGFVYDYNRNVNFHVRLVR